MISGCVKYKQLNLLIQTRIGFNLPISVIVIPLTAAELCPFKIGMILLMSTGNFGVHYFFVCIITTYGKN